MTRARCPACKHTGYRQRPVRLGRLGFATMVCKCDVCKGSGKLVEVSPEEAPLLSVWMRPADVARIKGAPCPPTLTASWR